MDTVVEFEISGQKLVEPDIFYFALTVTNPDNADNLLSDIKNRISTESNIEIIDISANRYLISQRAPEAKYILFLGITGRATLDDFIDYLKGQTDIEGGLVSNKVLDSDLYEDQLVSELLEKTQKRADSYGKLIGLHSNSLIGLTIKKDDRGGWKIYSPNQRIDRQSIYQAIFQWYNQKDSSEIKLTIKAEYRFF